MYGNVLVLFTFVLNFFGSLVTAVQKSPNICDVENDGPPRDETDVCGDDDGDDGGASCPC